MKMRIVYFAMIGLAVFASVGEVLAEEGNPGIVPIGSHFAIGQSYAALGAQWWQWALQAPTADNPLLDAMGEKCRVGQSGPVWFLAGTLGSGTPTSRECEIPSDKLIFFPVINEGYFAFLNDRDRTPEFLRAQLQCQDVQNLSVRIDGQAVARPEKFVTSAKDSPLFEVQLPTDNILGATPSGIPELLLSPSVHKGYYMLLKPLSPGSHSIAWTATWTCPFGSFSEDIRYNLQVFGGIRPGVE